VVIDIVLPAVFRLVRVGESSIIANGNELKWLGNVSSELFGVRRLDFDHFDGSEGDV